MYKYRDVVCKFWARVRLCNLELAVGEADEARRARVSHASRAGDRVHVHFSGCYTELFVHGK